MKYLCLILIILCNSLAAAEKIPVYTDPATGSYFKDWLVCGPFPNPLPPGINEYRHDATSLGFYRDYLKSNGGEANIRPYDGMKIKHPDGQQLTWQRYHGYFALVPLDEIFTPNTRTIAYAACKVHSSITRPVVLSVTSNDGVRVWHNGQLILDHNTGGTEEPDRDLVPMVLLPGDNHFLVKISQGSGKWSFQLRLLDLAATIRDLEERAWLFSRPEITETETNWHIFVGQKYKVELLPARIPARLEITSSDGTAILAAYDTFLGASLTIEKAKLNLLPGLYPVLCKTTRPDGMLHTMRWSIFVGAAPEIAASYQSFLTIPPVDTTSFFGQQIRNIRECLSFHLKNDLQEGNCAPMDALTQHQIVDRYAHWLDAMQQAPPPYHRVFPPIQNIELTGKGVFDLGQNRTINDLTHNLCQADLERLHQALLKKNIRLEPVTVNAAITIGLASDMPQQRRHFPNNDAYVIQVQPEQLTVIGASARGLHFALVTLRQIVEQTTTLPAVTLLDYPANAHRCAFTYWPVPMDETAKARLLEYVDLKYNEIVIATGKYQELDNPSVQKDLQVYFDLLRSFHVEPIPTVWLNGAKSWYEGVWLQDEPVIFTNDQASFGFQRLVALENSKPALHSEIGGGIVFARGRDYQIPSVEPPIITRVPTGTIPATATVYLDADIVDDRTHRFFKPCASEEAAYEEFDNNIRRTVEHLRPAKIHVNHDELGILNSDSRCRNRNMKVEELVAFQINRMRDLIKKHDPGVEMIMWADAVNPYHNAGKKALENVCDLLSKDIIMAHWYYTAENYEQVDNLELGTKFFLERGFRMYGCPWDHLVNHQAWEKVMRRHKDNSDCWGLLHTQWSGRNSGHSQTAAINWTGTTWLTQ